MIRILALALAASSFALVSCECCKSKKDSASCCAMEKKSASCCESGKVKVGGAAASVR